MSERVAARYALLRDLDTDPQFYPFGVLMERDDGGAKLLTYGRPPGAIGMRQEYDDFDTALEMMTRMYLVSAFGREGESSQAQPASRATEREAQSPLTETD